MGDGEGTLSIALLSGTDDKLNAAALLTAGAAALGRKVDILLQYWALDAFRAGNPTNDHGLAPEAGPDGADAVQRLLAEGGGQHWSAVSPRPRSWARSGCTPARCRWTCSAWPKATWTRWSTTWKASPRSCSPPTANSSPSEHDRRIVMSETTTTTTTTTTGQVIDARGWPVLGR